MSQMQWHRVNTPHTSQYGAPRPMPGSTVNLDQPLFGTMPGQGPSAGERRAPSSSTRNADVPDHQQPPTLSGQACLRSQSARASEVRTEDWRQTTDASPEERRLEGNKKRSVHRDYQRPFLKEMASAHAQNREPNIEIPVSSSGTVLGLKSEWHRAARLCARQTINYKVRSYKALKPYWESQVQCVAEKLSKKFTYSSPLDIKYLGKFLKNTLKNDRKIWKAHFIETGGSKHPKCPEEAFTEWKKYWVSAAGRDESQQMT